MLPEGQSYDYAHFEFVMRGIQKAREEVRFAGIADDISLSLHCETAEIMTAYTRMVEEDGTLSGLEAYHASRPPRYTGSGVSAARDDPSTYDETDRPPDGFQPERRGCGQHSPGDN